MRIRVQNPDFQLGNPDFQHGQVEILEKLFHEFDRHSRMRLRGRQCWTRGWDCEATNAGRGRQAWGLEIANAERGCQGWGCEAANAGRIGTFVSRYVQHAPLVQLTICWNFLKWNKAPSSVYQRHFLMVTKNKTENWFLKMLKIAVNLSLPDSQIPAPLSVVMWEVEKVWICHFQMPTAISRWIHQFSSDHWS